MNKKLTFLSFIMLLMLTAGCQMNRSANDTAYDLRKDKSAPDYMSNRANNRSDPEMTTNRANDKQHYVEDDITGQNPNFLDLDRTGSGSESGNGNHAIDIDKAKQVIAGTHEFVTDSVWINGDRMWVSVYKKGMLSNRDRRDAEARLHKKLMQALPRYNIEVRVKEDRR